MSPACLHLSVNRTTQHEAPPPLAFAENGILSANRLKDSRLWQIQPQNDLLAFCKTEDLNETSMKLTSNSSATPKPCATGDSDPNAQAILLGRLLIRHLLTNLYKIKDYTIDPDTFDKPKLAFADADLNLDFNISHPKWWPRSSRRWVLSASTSKTRPSGTGTPCKKYFSAHETKISNENPVP